MYNSKKYVKREDFWSNLLVIRHSVSSAIQTPRISSKILRGASYIQLFSWCLDIPMKHCLSCLIYYVMKQLYAKLKKKLYQKCSEPSMSLNILHSIVNTPESWTSMCNVTCHVQYPGLVRYRTVTDMQLFLTCFETKRVTNGKTLPYI